MTAGKIPLRARRGHCLVRSLLALALIASGCSSDNAPAVEGSLNFEVLDLTGNGGAGADGPTAAVATAAQAEFTELWEEFGGEPTAPLDGRIGVVTNVGFLYFNPTVVSVSGTDTWLVDISANRQAACNLTDAVGSPVVAIAVDAEIPPETIEVTVTERPGCDG